MPLPQGHRGGGASLITATIPRMEESTEREQSFGLCYAG